MHFATNNAILKPFNYIISSDYTIEQQFSNIPPQIHTQNTVIRQRTGSPYLRN